MAMRLSGLMSGMDTESIIQQLVSAKQTKVDKTKKAQTKLSWKQDAWKELNTKLKNLQSKYLNNMRFTTAFSKKVTKVSNSNAVSVITGEDAVNGVQSLEIKKLAKTGYLTGGEVKGADGGKVTAMSKLSDLGMTGEGSINVSTGSGTSVDIKVSGDSTISDVLNQLKNVGLNASFDEGNQRFFVSSKESGTASDFSISAMDDGGLAALSALGLQESVGNLSGIAVGSKEYEALSATEKEYVTYAKYYVAGNETATLENMQSMIDRDVQSKTDSYLAKYKSLVESKAAAEKKIAEIQDRYKDEDGNNTLKSVGEYTAAIEEKNAKIAELEESLKSGALFDDEKEKTEEKLAELKKEVSELTTAKQDAETLKVQEDVISAANKEIEGSYDEDGNKVTAGIKDYINITEKKGENGETVYEATASDKLTKEVKDRYYAKAEFANDVVTGTKTVSGGATKVNGQDAEIYLNGAKFTSTNNTFKINGLTFTALNETKEGEQITVTTEQDTDGIYDMVKNFLKEYNSIINEMDKLYNADSAKGYEPLTTEEKDAMSDSEVEEYEKKIKSALLRRDENLNSISSAMKSVMSAGISVGGKTMYLSDFGIETLGYFEAADNERNAYHIAGDPDDSSSAGKDDVLKSMIANDPNTVISFFTNLSRNLYDKMSELSKGQDGYRSFGNFYDDKKMKSDYESYTSKVKEQEQALNDYEDKWYKKFAAMETALAKMQNSANAVTSLLGG
ncbi:MAG: flagellar filament capping protein FliD [Acetatifactor sp.]|nr:flagellar filament capping protein FliD [Acetatifactor sp.]